MAEEKKDTTKKSTPKKKEAVEEIKVEKDSVPNVVKN